jgi:hypothetical protein
MIRGGPLPNLAFGEDALNSNGFKNQRGVVRAWMIKPWGEYKQGGQTGEFIIDENHKKQKCH